MSAAEKLRELIGDRGPASDLLLIRLAEDIRDRDNHDHDHHDDIHCLNLITYAGERMPYVLRRLADAEAEIERLRARHTALADEATKYLDRIAELEGGES